MQGIPKEEEFLLQSGSSSQSRNGGVGVAVLVSTLIFALGQLQFGFTQRYSSPVQESVIADLHLSLSQVPVCGRDSSKGFERFAWICNAALRHNWHNAGLSIGNIFSMENPGFSRQKMGRMEDFEASLKALWGSNVDISIEADEIKTLPMNMKGLVGSTATLVNCFTSWVITMTADLLLNWSSGGVFTLYTAMNAFAILFVILWVPETKGCTLEEIQSAFE